MIKELNFLFCQMNESWREWSWSSGSLARSGWSEATFSSICVWINATHDHAKMDYIVISSIVKGMHITIEVMTFVTSAFLSNFHAPNKHFSPFFLLYKGVDGPNEMLRWRSSVDIWTTATFFVLLFGVWELEYLFFKLRSTTRMTRAIRKAIFWCIQPCSPS